MTATAAAIAVERRRQAALLGALERPGEWAPGLRIAGPPARAAAALDAWRANAFTTAGKALGAVLPTVRRMLGDADFGRLAGEFRTGHPPSCGDLGEWGGAAPDFIEAHPGLRPWPWLADTARLDLARHRNERAADAAFQPASFERLQTAPPESLRLVLVPGTALVTSAWPLAEIDAAHRAGDADTAFAQLREAIETKRGESVMIVREGWRATVHRLDRSGVAWVRSLLAGRTVAESLESAGDDFDFPAWLTTAVRGAWLEGVVSARGRGVAAA